MALTEIPSELSSTPSIVDNGNDTAITIDSSENATFAGNVGIGTVVAPGINGSGLAIFDALYPRLTFRNNTTGDSSASTVGTAAYLIGDDFYLINQESAGDLIFGTATADPMRLSGGNLLVGTTNDAAGANNTNAGVSIRGGSDNRSFFSANSNYPMHLNRNTNDGEILWFAKNGGAVGSAGTTTSAGGTRFAIGAVGDPGIIFAGTGVFPATQITASDNSADLGSASYRWKDIYLSGGAYLGGTAAANKLDQYESGTWNPTIPGCTITVQRANYLKIGGLVHFSFTININSTDNSSAQTAIFGMPFVGSVANTESTSMYMASNVDFPNGTIMSNLYNYSRAGTIAFYVTYDNGALAGLPRSALSSSSTFWGSIVIQTDD